MTVRSTTMSSAVADRSTHDAVFGVFDEQRRQNLAVLATRILHYGVVALLLLWGSFKFFAFEAEAIRPLVEASPLMSWMYPLLGIRGTSALIGVVELAAALLMCTRHWKPSWSAIGSLIASGTFVVTLTFLFTTPNVLALDNPWGPFLLKDILLLGASLFSSAEALEAAAVRQRR